MSKLLRSVDAGYLMASFIAPRVERRSVAAHRATPQGAARVRKGILFVLTAILATFLLHSANTPMTASTFLAGALAIAVYVGLQVILKNDLVEVDGPRGRVTKIGLRASTVRSGDYAESM